jgi:amino acid transporter
MGPAFSIASTLGIMVAVSGSLALPALAATTVVMVLLALTFTQLAARYPDAGSSYGWARRAFGESAGTYTAWILLLANFFAVLATAIPAGSYTLALVAPNLVDNAAWDAGVGAVWTVACALILYLGIRSSARVAAALLIAELIVLGASTVASAMFAPHVSTGAAMPQTFGASGFVAAMVLAIWMVDGWEVSASTSEETRRAPRTAGQGGVLGLLVTAVFLFACSAAYLHAGGIAGLSSHQLDALAFVGTQLGGIWRTLLVITVLVSLTASLETTLLYLVRSVYAMGRDGVLPAALGRLGERTRDPDVSLVVVTIASLLALLLVALVPSASAGLSLVLDGTAVFLGILFLTSCAAALRLRAREDGPKDTPLYAATAGLALIVILFIAVAQAAPGTRTCIIAGIVLGIPLALAPRMRRRFGKVEGPAARNIGG